MQTKSQSPKKQQDYLRDAKYIQESNPKRKVTTFEVNPEVYDAGQLQHPNQQEQANSQEREISNTISQIN